MRKILKWMVISTIILLIGYLVSVTIADAYLMGIAVPYYSFKSGKSNS